MMNHVAILTLVILTFLLCRRMSVNHWFFAWGVVALPISYDFSVLHFVSVEQFRGWTPGVLLRLSDVFMALFLLSDRARAGGVRFSELFGFRAFQCFVVAACVSVVFASHRNYAVAATIEIVKDCVLYGYTTLRFLRDETALDALMRLLWLSLILQGGLGIIQFLCQDYYTILRTGGAGGWRTFFGTLMRSEGTLGQPNSYAGYLVPVMLVLVSFVTFVEGGMRRWYRVGLAVGGVGLLCSLSRSGWLAFLAGFFILSFHPQIRHACRLSQKVMLLLVVGGLALACPLVRMRVFGDDGGATEDRYWLAKHAWEIISNNYLTGVGINNYRFAMYEYMPADYEWNFIYRVHNLFLLVFAEMGLLGIIAITVLMVRPAYCCLFRLQPTSPKFTSLGVGLGAALVAMVLQNFSDTGWSITSLRSLFFILLAIVTFLRGAAHAG
jgi:hypothetical protein